MVLSKPIPKDLETFYQYLIANIQLYPTSVLRTLETLTAASDEPPAPCFLFDLSIFLFSIFQSLKFSPIKSASSLSCYFAAVSATVSSARLCSIPFWLLSAKLSSSKIPSSLQMVFGFKRRPRSMPSCSQSRAGFPERLRQTVASVVWVRLWIHLIPNASRLPQ